MKPDEKKKDEKKKEDKQQEEIKGTWAEDAKEDLEDYIEEQGVYLRQ